jgi:hypothetical protein
VLRIELAMSLFAGVSGGLVGLLWSRLVSIPWLARLDGTNSTAWRPETLTSVVGSASLHAAGGAALGFLFWLGWGLISLVNAPWYVAGLLFGLLVWAGSAVPLLGGLALRAKWFRSVASVLALEWLATGLAIGLLCALAWHRYA